MSAKSEKKWDVLGLFDEGEIFGKKPTEQTVKQDPWEGVQPYLLNYYGRLQDYMDQGGQTAADVSPETEAAWSLATNRALSGSPITSAAQQNIYDTLSGNMFEPAFNKQYDYAAGKLGETFRDITLPAITSRFSASGRTGSGAEQDMYARAMGELGTSLSGLAADIYGQERKNQMGALTLAPSIAGMDYGDIGMLGNVGAERQAQAQTQLDMPLANLSSYGSLLQPGLGFGSTTQPLYKNTLGSTLGGAAAGQQIGSSIGSGYGGWGALAGALLGYLGNR